MNTTEIIILIIYFMFCCYILYSAIDFIFFINKMITKM